MNHSSPRLLFYVPKMFWTRRMGCIFFFCLQVEYGGWKVNSYTTWLPRAVFADADAAWYLLLF